MRRIEPDKKLLYIWQIRAALSAVAPAVAVSLFFRLFQSGWIMLTLAWVALYSFLIAVYLPMRHKSCVYLISDTSVEIKLGAFYKTTKLIWSGNIEFASLTAAPDERLFGLSSLRLFAAGGKITLPGLCLGEARRLWHDLGCPECES